MPHSLQFCRVLYLSLSLLNPFSCLVRQLILDTNQFVIPTKFESGRLIKKNLAWNFWVCRIWPEIQESDTFNFLGADPVNVYTDPKHCYGCVQVFYIVTYYIKWVMAYWTEVYRDLIVDGYTLLFISCTWFLSFSGALLSA